MTPAVWTLRLAFIAAFFGLFAAGVLSTGHWLKLAVPCGGSQGCQTVAMHPSSRLLGVPIAYVGFAAYLVIIAILTRVSHSRLARQVLCLLAAIGTLASAGLLIYSAIVIQATCWWCIASGAAMASLLGLALVMLRAKQPPAPIAGWFLVSLALVVSTALGAQAGWMKQQANQPPVPAERLVSLTAVELVDPNKTLGPQDAPVTVVMFSDLWCPMCRVAHDLLTKVQKTQPDLVRLAYRHRPLAEIRGHESSGAAAALSEIAAEQGKFWSFIEEIYCKPKQLDRDGYLQLLEQLEIDGEAAENRIADPKDAAVEHVWRDQMFAESIGIHATPTFIVIVEGHPPLSANLGTLPKLLNQAIAIAPRKPSP
jgi:protein-disulfide isomerase